MAIKFDTLDELKAFYRAFKLSGAVADEMDVPVVKGKRGRKPGSKLVKEKAVSVDTTGDDTPEPTPKKRGRKPGFKVVKTQTPATKKTKKTDKAATPKKTGAGKGKVGRPPGSKSKDSKSKATVTATAKAKPGRKPGVKKATIAKLAPKKAAAGKTKTVKAKS